LGFSRYAWLFSLLVSLGFLILFWKIGDPFPILKEQSGLFSIEIGISRIGVIGVALMGILSGIGAVEYPLQNMTSFMRGLSTVQAQIQQAEQQYIQNTNKLIGRKKRLHVLQKELKSPKNERPTPSEVPISGLGRFNFSRFVSPMWGTRKNEEILNLISEIHLLENFNNELFEEVNEFRNEEARIKFSQTTLGRLSDLSGYFFSVYCAWKIFISTINILLNRVSQKDPVTLGFEILFRFCDVPLNVQFWSQYISFILVGILIATSIRGFLKKFLALFHTYSSSVSVTTSYMGLILGQVMGIYFVSNILLLRMSLPEEYREMITKVLGDIKFDFYHRWFDFIFIPSALVALFLFIVSAGRKPITQIGNKVKQLE